MRQDGYLDIKEENIKIEYYVKISHSRYIYLRFKSDLKLEVVVPFYSSKNAEAIVKEKSSWIRKKYKELLQRKKIFDGKMLLVDGEYYPVTHNFSDKEEITLTNNRLIVETNEQNIIPIVKSWMKKRTEAYLKANLSLFAEKLEVKFACFKVRDVCRWGYCNKRHELFFSLQLSSLSNELKDYILLHELLHLIEFNHSKKFHKLIEKYCPDRKRLEMSLNQVTTIRRGKNCI